MTKEWELPNEVWCRDGWGCFHVLIRNLCRELMEVNGNRLKSEEGQTSFEKKLGLLKVATAELEKILLPFLEQNMPISEMPCHYPNFIAWGRNGYQKGLARLEQIKPTKKKSQKKK